MEPAPKPLASLSGEASSFSRFTQKVNEFFADVVNPTSMLSTFVLGMCATFICVGHYLDYRLHSTSVPFLFFLSPVALMIIYAAGYCTYANARDSFDGGLMSARCVLRWIYYMTSFSFAVAGYQYLQPGWLEYPDQVTTMLCLWANPALMLVFAITYGVYSSSSKEDMVKVTPWHNASARRSMALTTALTMALFFYNTWLAAKTLDVTSIFVSLASFAGAFSICFVVMLVFQNTVDVSTDRGVKLR